MSIQKEIVNGVFWTSVQKYSGVLIALLVSAVLARLISPEDFGLIAMVTVILSFLLMFTDLGIGSAIIQNKTLSEKDIRILFTDVTILGVILSAIFFFSAPLVARYYNNSQLTVICQCFSLTLLFVSLNIVPNALILRSKSFKFIAKRTLFLQIISGSIAIYTAYKGFGVYALLIAPIFTNIGIFTLNYQRVPIKFHFSLDFSAIKKIYSYSVYQFLFGFINYFSRNLDKLLIGKYIGVAPLGYYDKSYRLMLLPLQNITEVITPVLHPILSTLQDDKSSLAAKYIKIIQFISIISFPLGVFIYFSASDLINIVYGDNWNAAIPVFEILALSLPLQMILSTTGSIFQAANATKTLFYVGVSNTIVTVTSFTISIIFFGTIESIAWAWTISLVVNSLITYFIMFTRVFRSSFIPVIKTLYIPTIVAVILLVLLFLFSEYSTFGIIGSLIFKSLISFSVSILIVYLTNYFNIRTYLNNKIKTLLLR